LGIVKALKAQYLIYRLTLRFYLWMEKLGREKYNLVVVLGG